MACVIIVGAQWGDEGKGKIVDIYTEHAEMVVRSAGGANAGHTLVVGDEKVVVRLLPSGILRDGVRCVLAQGMVVDPSVFVGELESLQARGCKDLDQRVRLSERAHLVLEYHQTLDALREQSGNGRAIGTTKKGIGPAFEDKVRRSGVLAGDLREPARLRARIEEALHHWAPVLAAYGVEAPSVGRLCDQLEPLRARIVPLLSDTAADIHAALTSKRNVLLEGAQGTLLDIDHGTYPYVTSSSPCAAGAAAGAGIGPTRVDRVIGIAKAYATRVGEGPFPTELLNETGERLRRIGAEFGSVTGRPRRTGWFDLPALKYAARINGLDGLALTKLDVLTGLDSIEVCVAYDTPHGRTDDLPIELLCRSPELVKPVYESFAGWQQPLHSLRRMEDLPSAARAYVDMLESRSGVPLYLVSVGARRSETIAIHDPFAA
jgi:adenylosuccinate synthase